MIVLYVIVGIGALGNLAGGDDSDGDTTAGAETTTTEAAGTETTVPTTDPEPTTTTVPPTTTTTVPPTTTTTLPPGFDPFTVEGSGDDFIEFSTPGDLPAVLEITYTGGSNFSITSYTRTNDYVDLLVNEIGAYEGVRPINFAVGDKVGFLEISASGPWTINAVYLLDLEIQTGQAAGSGDDVIIMNVDSAVVDITHDGSSNFAIWAWTTDDRDLLVNEIGPYDGTVRSLTGFVIYDIAADGNWTISN